MNKAPIDEAGEAAATDKVIAHPTS